MFAHIRAESDLEGDELDNKVKRIRAIRRAGLDVGTRYPEAGRGPVGKAAVVGAKDRETNQVAAKVVRSVDGKTLNGFVDEHADPEAAVGSSCYKGRRNHWSVSHSTREYVRYLKDRKIHTNGVESFWSMLKRAHKGTFHWLDGTTGPIPPELGNFANLQSLRLMGRSSHLTGPIPPELGGPAYLESL